MDVTDVIGQMGKTQYKALVALLFRPLSGAFVTTALQTSLIEYDYWCSPTETYRNLTSEEWKECCVPKQSSGKYSRCELYSEDYLGNVTRDTVSCSSWVYNRTLEYQSLRADWNLVCSRGWYITLLYAAFILGNLSAYIPTGYFADRFGRKRLCLVGLFVSSCFALCASFSTQVEHLIVFMYFLGVSFAFVQNPFICLYIECVGVKYRNWVIFSFSGTWGISAMFASTVAYLIPNWRIMFILASFPAHLPAFLLLWLLVPESARWLLTAKKYKEAEKIIFQQAKENGIEVDDPKRVMEELKKKVEMDKDKQGRATFWDLFKDRHILRITLILFVAMFSVVFVNHGYVLVVGRLGGSLHINLLINGAMDILALAFFLILVRYTSRKRGLLLTFILTGIFFLATIPIGDDLWWLRVTFAMLGRFCIGTAYSLLYILSSEIFPTSLRVVGVSGSMSAGRLGSILASFLDDLGRVYGKGVPIAMFGILSLVTSAVFLLLPDLKSRNLPDSLAETRMMTSIKRDSPSAELRPLDSNTD